MTYFLYYPVYNPHLLNLILNINYVHTDVIINFYKYIQNVVFVVIFVIVFKTNDN